MIKVRRLNMDTSWQISWEQTSMILDPWLVGTEVDGFSWFNEQWHATPPLTISEPKPYDAIIVSQSYSDHCHPETIKQLDNRPILCTPTVTKKLSKQLPDAKITKLPDFMDGELLEFNDVNLAYLDPGRKIDPIYYGIVMISADRAIVYAPHGFTITDHQLEKLAAYKVDLLITSFSLFKLPFLLGGAVNPGLKKAKELIAKLDPTKVVHTHDENKHAKGIVKMIANVKYYDAQTLQSKFKGKFVYLDEAYEEYIVSD